MRPRRCRLPGRTGGDHSRASAAFYRRAAEEDRGADIHRRRQRRSDHRAEVRAGHAAAVAPARASKIPGSNTGVCGWGYSCAYTNSMSWAAPNKPLPHEINPQVVFERLFGDGGTPEERLAAQEGERQHSGRVIDRVSRPAARRCRRRTVAARRLSRRTCAKSSAASSCRRAASGESPDIEAAVRRAASRSTSTSS